MSPHPLALLADLADLLQEAELPRSTRRLVELVGNLGQTAETLREYLMGVKGSDLRAQATAEAGLLESLTALKVLEPEFGLNFNDEFGTYDCNTCNHGTTFGQPASTVRHAPDCAVIALRRHYRAALAQSGGEL